MEIKNYQILISLINLPIVPILGLLCLGVLDHLGREEVPVLLQSAGLGLLVVNENLVAAVGVENEGVQMAENVVLASDILKSKAAYRKQFQSQNIQPSYLP